MARKFRFRLEVVRRVRRQARDEQRRVVAERIRSVTEVERRIERFARGIEHAAEDLRAVQAGVIVDTASLRAGQAYRVWLHREIEEARAQRAQRGDELAREQARLAEASKQLKVIERLRERQWERHRLEVAREEQAIGDEAALHMYLRRNRNATHEVRS